MPNVSKVIYGNNTIIDLTSDTITPSDVLNSKSFHDASGTLRTGSADISGKADKVSGATNGDLAGLDASGNLTDSGKKASDFASSAIMDGTNLDSFGDVETALTGKVDKVTGKGLSTNDYTDAEKAKVAGAFPRSEQAELGAYNELPFPYADSATTTNGVTITIDTDGVVTCSTGESGATGNVFFILMSNTITNKFNGRRLVGCPIGGAANKYSLEARVGSQSGDTYVTSASDFGNGAIIPSVDTSTQHIRFYVRIQSGTILTTPIKFKPMITTDLTATYADFQPYAMTNKELTDVKADKTELDGWSSQSQVSSGSITFTGIDDTNNNGYELFINVDASSTQKNPSSQIESISGTGTSSMSITFSTDADEGAYGKLRIIR